MSINRNRAKLNKVFNKREYHLRFLNEEYPPYWDEGLNYYPGWSKRGYIEYKRPKKRLLFYQVRMYKTWKHNRKTQYK